MWERLEGSVWLFRVAEMFSCNFQIKVIHFADAPAAAIPSPAATATATTMTALVSLS
jgi:hypothetical protein